MISRLVLTSASRYGPLEVARMSCIDWLEEEVLFRDGLVVLFFDVDLFVRGDVDVLRDDEVSSSALMACNNWLSWSAALSG